MHKLLALILALIIALPILVYSADLIHSTANLTGLPANSSSAPINLVFSYTSGDSQSNFDPDADGVEDLRGIIDFSVAETTFAQPFNPFGI